MDLHTTCDRKSILHDFYLPRADETRASCSACNFLVSMETTLNSTQSCKATSKMSISLPASAMVLQTFAPKKGEKKKKPSKIYIFFYPVIFHFAFHPGGSGGSALGNSIIIFRCSAKLWGCSEIFNMAITFDEFSPHPRSIRMCLALEKRDTHSLLPLSCKTLDSSFSHCDDDRIVVSKSR